MKQNATCGTSPIRSCFDRCALRREKGASNELGNIYSCRFGFPTACDDVLDESLCQPQIRVYLDCLEKP